MPDNCVEDRELLKTNLHLQMETAKSDGLFESKQAMLKSEIKKLQNSTKL
jgi:hypothetical protein